MPIYTKKGNKYIFDKEKLQELCSAGEKSMQAVADEIGIARITLQRAIKENGIKWVPFDREKPRKERNAGEMDLPKTFAKELQAHDFGFSVGDKVEYIEKKRDDGKIIQTKQKGIVCQITPYTVILQLKHYKTAITKANLFLIKTGTEQMVELRRV